MRRKNSMTLSRESILRATLLGLVRVPELKETLVFKGGNALDWFHSGSGRASTDLDFSIEASANELDMSEFRQLARSGLSAQFDALGLHLVNLSARLVPPQLTAEFSEFWGGVKLSFRLATSDVLAAHGDDPHELNRRALLVDGVSQIEVDISCHEHCSPRELKTLDGETLYVYATPLIVAEKIRALCQQTDAYRAQVGGQPRGRAQDLFDIHTLLERLDFSPRSVEFIELLVPVFAAKRCDKSLLLEVRSTRELHRADFENKLMHTISPRAMPLEFDDYFEYVCRLTDQLHAAWIE